MAISRECVAPFSVMQFISSLDHTKLNESPTTLWHERQLKTSGAATSAAAASAERVAGIARCVQRACRPFTDLQASSRTRYIVQWYRDPGTGSSTVRSSSRLRRCPSTPRARARVGFCRDRVYPDGYTLYPCIECTGRSTNVYIEYGRIL